MNVKEIILKYALQNAVRYGSADFKAVTGRVFSEADVRDKKALLDKIRQVVEEVNGMKQGERISKLMEIDPKLLEDKPKEERKELPELENVKGRVVMRFAPNPSGAISLGRSRQAILNWLYCQKYNGNFILRFDDSDPKIKVPEKEAYKWIEEDLKWLGINPWKIVIQSSRLEIYYKYAWELFKMGKMYICKCDPEKEEIITKGEEVRV